MLTREEARIGGGAQPNAMLNAMEGTSDGVNNNIIGNKPPVPWQSCPHRIVDDRIGTRKRRTSARYGEDGASPSPPSRAYENNRIA